VTGEDEFSGVDFDLLADYVGGALDGTPEHGTVATLIARDPAWRTAHDELMQGMTAVRTDLSALGSSSEPMPADLAERLDEAFAAATPRLDPDLATAGPVAIDGELGAPGRPRLEAVRGDASEPHRARVPKKGLRKRRWVAPLAVAAGLLAFVGFGLNYLSGLNRSSSDTAASSSAGRGENAPMMAPGAAGLVAGLPPATDIRSSGTDYQPTMLRGSASAKVQKAAPAPNVATDSAIDPLARLRPADALLGCLGAIAVANGGGTITVQDVDYARFEGTPALVVRFTAANGTWAWASRADCGTQEAGASTLAHAKVG
jgi:hypothetical protein